MYEERWRAEHNRLAEALGEILLKSRTLIELRQRVEALRKAVRVAETERKQITSLSAVPMCKQLHFHGGEMGEATGPEFVEVGVMALPDVHHRGNNCEILDARQYNATRNKLGFTLLSKVLSRIGGVTLAGVCHTIQARASSMRVAESRLRALHAELKKALHELQGWKSGTNVQAKAGRNALYRSLFYKAELDAITRGSFVATLAAWRQNLRLEKELEEKKKQGEGMRVALAASEKNKLRYRLSGMKLLAR